MTVAGSIFGFVAVVTLAVTGGIFAIMVRDPKAGLAKLDHREGDLPAVMTGRYLTFFVMAIMAAAYGDLRVMLGLHLGFLVASLADSWIYWRAGQAYGRHFMAAMASGLAAGLLAYAIAA